MTVAIVHDYATQRGGAERVVLSMMKAFPGAPLHTSLYEPAGTFPEFAEVDIRTSVLNHIGLLRRSHRFAFPVLAPVFAARRVDADVVLCSSSGWAHGVHATGRKIVYCYTPARWLYQGHTYLGDRRSSGRYVLSALRGPLTRWDRRMALTADRYLTLSTVVRDRIWATYGIEAEVLPPPHTIDVDGRARPQPGVLPGFFLCVARLLPYKNVDAVVTAFGELADQHLVVVGTGPELDRITRLAGPNVTLLRTVDDEGLRWLYASCTAVVSASYEDYGLTPLEGAAFGKPAAVLRGGGFLDTVVDGGTGIFFGNPVPAEIARAVRLVLAQSWSPAILQAHAAHFSEDRFIRRLRQIVNEELGAPADRPAA